MVNTNEKDRYLNNVNHKLNNEIIFVTSTIFLVALIIGVIILGFYEHFGLFPKEDEPLKLHDNIIMGVFVVCLLIMLVSNIVSAIQWSWINKLKKKFGEKQFKNFKNVRATYIMNTGLLFACAFIIIIANIIIMIKDDIDISKKGEQFFTYFFSIIAVIYVIGFIISGFVLSLKNLYKKNPVLEEVE